MLLILVTTMFLNVLGQRNSGFFNKRDYEYRDYGQRSPYQGGGYGDNSFPDHRYQDFKPRSPYQVGGYGDKSFPDHRYQDFKPRSPYQGGGYGDKSFPDHRYQDFKPRNPYQEGGYKDKSLLDHQTKKPFIVDMSVYDKLDEQLQKYNKYEEFKEFTDQVKERTRMDPSRTVQDELKEILQWSRNVDREPMYQRRPPEQNIKAPPIRPSPGMSPYWGETEQENNKNHVFPAASSNAVKLTGNQALKIALRNLQNIKGIDKKPTVEKNPEVMKNLTKSDDYNSPIKWVPLDSNDTKDGLAKVTDPRTGKNQQFILNETIFVPVIDYNLERLGLTTTTHRPVLSTDKRVLLTAARSVDFKKIDSRDWLAFENALGSQNESIQCHGDGCHSRCKTLACESVCRGDTCASGCIGAFCNTFCKGPGCLSMCIGESCTAKCSAFSCSYVINGRHASGGGTWGDHYPQYDEKNIRYIENE